MNFIIIYNGNDNRVEKGDM